MGVAIKKIQRFKGSGFWIHRFESSEVQCLKVAGSVASLALNSRFEGYKLRIAGSNCK